MKLVSAVIVAFFVGTKLFGGTSEKEKSRFLYNKNSITITEEREMDLAWKRLKVMKNRKKITVVKFSGDYIYSKKNGIFVVWNAPEYWPVRTGLLIGVYDAKGVQLFKSNKIDVLKCEFDNFEKNIGVIIYNNKVPSRMDFKLINFAGDVLYEKTNVSGNVDTGLTNNILFNVGDIRDYM